MAFNARFLVENPDDIIFTMKITMTARESGAISATRCRRIVAIAMAAIS